MEPVNLQGDRDDIDADTLVGDLAKAFKKVQMSVVWHRTMHFGVPQKVLKGFCGYFTHAGTVLFEDEVSNPTTTITAMLPGFTWSVSLPFFFGVQDA